jgi:hypothetical protein
MWRNFFGMGLSDADKQRLNTQMSLLNAYITKNNVQIVKNDFENPFMKRDFKNENKLRGDIISKLSDSKNPGQLRQLLKAQEELLRKEYFLKVDKDGFVSIGGTRWLDFDKAHISEIIGLKVTALKEYQNQINQFMDNFFFSRDATTTVNPEKDETNTLLKTFLRAAKKRTEERKAEEAAKFLSSQREQRFKQRSGESDDDFRRRIIRIEEDEEYQDLYQDLIDPNNCLQNFRNFLKTPVDAIIGIGERHRHRGKTIYIFLVESLGSIEDGFDKQYRTQTKFLTKFLDYYGTDSQKQQMAKFAEDRKVQQGFIDTLCGNGNAREILIGANSKDIEGGQYYDQTTRGDDIYSKNVWKALRLCLECLEEYILKEYMPQLPDVPKEQSPPPPPPPPSAPPLDIIDDYVVGGKLKSRSKSIRKKRISHRKKRISHRKKKSHSHKRRALKRRAVN